MMLVSPLGHAAFCLLGMLLQRRFAAFVEESLLAAAVFTILAAGVFLTATYQPGGGQADEASCRSSVDVRCGTKLVALSSADALIAGLVHGCWGSTPERAAIQMVAINFVMVSCAALVGKVLARGGRQDLKES
jgi:hypothetical protein